MEFHLGTTMKFAFDFVMLERKQKQGFEFIHIQIQIFANFAGW